MYSFAKGFWNVASSRLQEITENDLWIYSWDGYQINNYTNIVKISQSRFLKLTIKGSKYINDVNHQLVEVNKLKEQAED